jgi:hypothetical protein
MLKKGLMITIFMSPAKIYNIANTSIKPLQP